MAQQLVNHRAVVSETPFTNISWFNHVGGRFCSTSKVDLIEENGEVVSAANGHIKNAHDVNCREREHFKAAGFLRQPFEDDWEEGRRKYDQHTGRNPTPDLRGSLDQPPFPPKGQFNVAPGSGTQLDGTRQGQAIRVSRQVVPSFGASNDDVEIADIWDSSETRVS